MSKQCNYENVVKEQTLSENGFFREIIYHIDQQELIQVIRDMDRRIEDLERKVTQK